MGNSKFIVYFILTSSTINVIYGGISAYHEFKSKLVKTEPLSARSPHKVLKHLDDTLLRATKNVTQNAEMDENLYQISKDLVTSILGKLEVQDKITRITREALDASGSNKGVTAIETRRILDYISRTLSSNILSITRSTTEPELHRLVYGLAQIASEISIVAALKDITYATSLSKKQSIDLSLRRKKRSPLATLKGVSTPKPFKTSTINNGIVKSTNINKSTEMVYGSGNTVIPSSPFDIYSSRNPLRLFRSQPTLSQPKGFLNQTALDIENNLRQNGLNNTDMIVVERPINSTHYVEVDPKSLDVQESVPVLTDDWLDTKDSTNRASLSPELIADMELEQGELDDDIKNDKKAKQKMDKLELKAKKAILYAGDVAFLTAGSVVAMRRALTASIEVSMSVRYAKNGMSNHQELMMNLAKTAAQQAGKEAKSATSKSLACERVVKLALKYTSQSQGAKLNHIANRIVMDSLSLSTLAKSMAFVSSDIAINSLYQATDVKPPSE